MHEYELQGDGWGLQHCTWGCNIAPPLRGYLGRESGTMNSESAATTPRHSHNVEINTAKMGSGGSFRRFRWPRGQSTTPTNAIAIVGPGEMKVPRQLPDN